MNFTVLRTLLVLTLTAGSLANAQVVRTWVSGSGIDNVACDRSNPCRSFAAAITAVGQGGEVVVLDSAGYGAVTIDKAVSIISPAGIFAAIAPTSGSAITIGTVSGSVVVLRGLTLNGRGADFGISNGGITTPSSNRVYVEDCVISGFDNMGIDFTRTGTYTIRDTVVRENNTAIRFAAMPATSRGVLDRVRMERNASAGLTVRAGNFMVRDTIASYNAEGFIVGEAVGFEGAEPVVQIENSQATHGDNGFVATAGARLLLFRSVASFNTNRGILLNPSSTGHLGGNTVTRNFVGLNIAGGSATTSADNVIEMNDTNTNMAGPMGSITKH